MKILIKVFILILALFSLTSSNSQNFEKSEIVFFNDSNVIDLLEGIVIQGNTCSQNGKVIDWYIDFEDKYRLIVSRGRIENLLEIAKSEKKRIYTTSINNQIVFISTSYDCNLFTKTRFFIDLKQHLNKAIVVFEDFSSWLITRDKKDDFVIKNKRIFKCND
jgi:hypothetical protein